MPDPDCPYVSRGGLKLEAALDAFALDVTGRVCADLGCSTGGFTDCLLQRGAARVFAVDTAYGELAWRLRQDPRVTVMERTYAVHADPHPDAVERGGCDLVAVDLGWTRQEKAVPAALRWLRPRRPDDGVLPGIITLIKPHYESGTHRMTEDEADAESLRVADHVLPGLGVEVLGLVQSSVRGGKGKNLEHLALIRPRRA